MALLKPPSELLGFRYLNKIGVKNEHFDSTTLSDKQSPKIYKIGCSNRVQVSIVQKLQTCKQTYNF